MNKRRLMNQINVVPYIDVMLVLLIIFMVTAPMTNPGVVELPKVGQALKQTTQPIVVSIKKDGVTEIEGKQYKRDDLLVHIKKQTERNQKLLKDFSDEEISLLQKLLNKLLLSSQKYLIFN